MKFFTFFIVYIVNVIFVLHIRYFDILDRNLHLYDSSTSRYSYIKHEKGRDIDWSILDAAFTPDGRTIIFSSWSNYSKF